MHLLLIVHYNFCAFYNVQQLFIIYEAEYQILKLQALLAKFSFTQYIYQTCCFIFTSYSLCQATCIEIQVQLQQKITTMSTCTFSVILFCTVQSGVSTDFLVLLFLRFTLPTNGLCADPCRNRDPLLNARSPGSLSVIKHQHNWVINSLLQLRPLP